MFGSFGFIIQIVLGIIAFMVLILKRYLEKPRRPWKIWFFDASKQIISACVVHLLNLLFSYILSNDKSSDECVWYFVTMFIDCTVGVVISYFFMWLVDGVASVNNWKYLQSGLYFEEYYRNGKKKYRVKPKMYFSQLGVWLVVSVIGKLILLALVKICERFFENFGSFILTPFTNGKVRLVMVMIVFPLILNGIYFWLTDNILKLNVKDNDLKDFYIQEVKGVKQVQTEENNNDNNNKDNGGSNNGNKFEHKQSYEANERSHLTNDKNEINNIGINEKPIDIEMNHINNSEQVEGRKIINGNNYNYQNDIMKDNDV